MALKWGIVSAGKISHDFVTAFRILNGTENVIVAVAAKDKDRADSFAKRHNIPAAYSNYQDLAADPNIDVVYIGSLNPEHFPISKLMLENGKHVICEKPLCLNSKLTEELIKLAKQKKLFLMEAVWSRFFPVYEQLRNTIKNGAIGDVKQVIVNFGLLIEAERVKSKVLGGGAVLDIGVYAFQFAMLIFGRNTHVDIVSAGHLNKEGVDESYTCIVKYAEGQTASLILHTKCKLENNAVVYGTKGQITVHEPFWCPTKITINGELQTHPLPVLEGELYNYENSAGLHYQAKEVHRCIKKGLLESPLMSHDDSLALSKMEDEVRKQLGVIFNVDHF